MARPLTKRNSAGELYVRPPLIEAQINEILAQSPATLQQRLSIEDSQSSNYLKSECLVHLARDFIRHGKEAMTKADMVLRVLFDRCEKILLVKIPNKGRPSAAYIREEVLGQFAELFAIDGAKENSDRLDFFECRFDRAFRTFRIDLVRKETNRLKKLDPLPIQDVDTLPSSNKQIPTRLIKALRSPEKVESSVLLKEIHEAINALPEDERRAVILCHVLGYKIESKNPEESTAATICKVSGRTIRNRLTRAVGKLSKFKEEILS